MSFVGPIILEFSLLTGLLLFYCGPLYVLNVALMVGTYTAYTKWYSNLRNKHIEDRFSYDKKADFFYNESIQNFETVKYFVTEQFESERYS